MIQVTIHAVSGSRNSEGISGSSAVHTCIRYVSKRSASVCAYLPLVLYIITTGWSGRSNAYRTTFANLGDAGNGRRTRNWVADGHRNSDNVRSANCAAGYQTVIGCTG